MPSSYASSVAFLYGLQRHGIKLGLETIRSLLTSLDHPERRFHALHIGGTNGKGSTAAIVASVLASAGYRVGLYTSPHLVDFRERIRVNGEPIPEDRVARLTDDLRTACPPELNPTFFEFTTAMAFRHFAEAGVDAAVLEVGLGGRYDATNVITPLVSCITTVSFDHEEFLGHDLASIAFEKAGIIKPLVPVVTGSLPGEAARVVEVVAKDQQAPLYRSGKDFSTLGRHPGDCRFNGRRWTLPGLHCPLQGTHQLDNLGCALMMTELAAERGLVIPEQAVRDGVSNVQWEGRLETVEREPLLLLDGAHNPAAADALSDYLRQLRTRPAHPNCSVILLVGMMRDKDHAGFLRALVPLADQIVLTQAEMARSATVDTLRAAIPSEGPPVHLAPAVADALALARRLARPSDVICVTGSLMIIGEVKALLRGSALSPLRG
jgi:dihydrofolate synthase/folylpolyglutamate synthase